MLEYKHLHYWEDGNKPYEHSHSKGNIPHGHHGSRYGEKPACEDSGKDDIDTMNDYFNQCKEAATKQAPQPSQDGLAVSEWKEIEVNAVFGSRWGKVNIKSELLMQKSIDDAEWIKALLKVGIMVSKPSELLNLTAIGKSLDDEKINAIIKELTEKISDLKHDNQMLRDKSEGSFWLWQGDGEDHIESLTCPILIKAEDMRTIDAKLNQNNLEWEECLHKEEARWKAYEKELRACYQRDMAIMDDDNKAEIKRIFDLFDDGILSQLDDADPRKNAMATRFEELRDKYER